MDTVFIEGLEIEALIGIYDWERRIRQPLLFDLELAFDNRRPAASDAIADTLDYKAVSKRLIEFVSQSDFGLVETLAERCAALVLDEFGVQQLRLKLSKPGAVRGARAVGVIIERRRDSDLEGGGHGERPQQAPTQRASVPAEAAVSTTEPPPATASAPMHEIAATTSSSPPAANSVDRAGPRAEIAAASPAAKRRQPASPDGKRRPASGAAAPMSSRFRTATARVYASIGSNVEPEQNLREAVAALRARFGEVLVSPVYRTPSVGFVGPDFLNAIVVFDSDIHPFALNDWLHAQEVVQGRDRRDAFYSNRPLDMDIIYFGDLILDGPGELQLPRPELRHAYVLKPLVDVAPEFVDPIRGTTLAQLWAAHPQHDSPPQCVALDL